MLNPIDLNSVNWFDLQNAVNCADIYTAFFFISQNNPSKFVVASILELRSNFYNISLEKWLEG
ncbi:hypothetical protein B9Z31_15170 [Limnohabitans sp. G3-2]|nr:hypothetical protein B9Z31_15170 [Limnohabitans sp. G3-2]